MWLHMKLEKKYANSLQLSLSWLAFVTCLRLAVCLSAGLLAGFFSIFLSRAKARKLISQSENEDDDGARSSVSILTYSRYYSTSTLPNKHPLTSPEFRSVCSS